MAVHLAIRLAVHLPVDLAVAGLERAVGLGHGGELLRSQAEARGPGITTREWPVIQHRAGDKVAVGQCGLLLYIERATER